MVDKRSLGEQFRKRRHSLFQRVHETSAVCEANILIVVEKNNRLHVYGTMDNPAKLLCEECKVGLKSQVLSYFPNLSGQKGNYLEATRRTQNHIPHGKGGVSQE